MKHKDLGQKALMLDESTGQDSSPLCSFVGKFRLSEDQKSINYINYINLWNHYHVVKTYSASAVCI